MSLDQFLLSADTTDLNYPEIRPTLDLNFARVKTLDPRITFTRASSGSYFGADGILKYAGVNEARFDHNPVTGESLGLLIEEPRANLLLRSEEFDNASWTTLALNATVSANQTTAPDGATTADSIADDAVNNVHYIGQSVAVAAATTYTFSCFLRAGTSSFGYLSLSGGGPGWADTFVVNLSTGVGNIQAGSFGSTSIQAFANGWYRVVVTKITTGSGSPQLRIGVAQSLSVISYSSSGSNIFAWGAQLEVGAFPTSYIPTTTSSRTRVADNAQITGTNFSSWYNQPAGSVYAEFSPAFQGSASAQINNPGVWGVTQGSLGSFNGYGVRLVPSSLFIDSINGISRYAPGAFNNQVSIGLGAYLNTGQNYKTMFAWEPSGIAGSNQGQTAITNTNPAAAAMGTHDQFYLGRQNVGGVPTQLNGHIRRLTYWPKRLPNSQLQALTR